MWFLWWSASKIQVYIFQYKKEYMSIVISRYLEILAARLSTLDSSLAEAEWNLFVDGMGGGEIISSGGSLDPSSGASV